MDGAITTGAQLTLISQVRDFWPAVVIFFQRLKPVAQVHGRFVLKLVLGIHGPAQAIESQELGVKGLQSRRPAVPRLDHNVAVHVGKTHARQQLAQGILLVLMNQVTVFCQFPTLILI